MPVPDPKPPAEPRTPRRVLYFNAGFLRQKRIRRIMELAGLPLRLGRPGAEDAIAVWGRSPYAVRGEAMAARSGADLIRIEDAFLRSLFPGRAGEPPLGLLIDRTGVHFDSTGPSDLETLLATRPLDDTPLLDRARAGIARLQEAHLTKYSGVDPQTPCPEPGYVLVIDQTRGDASVIHGGATADTFRDMLVCARMENPGARVLIKTHPETVRGHRKGYFGPDDVCDGVELCSDTVSPWTLMEGAIGVYTVTSQLGFEAIFAGHRPQVFGQPFYAGWDLTQDRHPHPLARRGRRLSRAQLFAAAMILYPTWYDPCRDRLCSFEDAIAHLEAQTRAWRADHRGWVAAGMRLWKRAPLQRVFGQQKRLLFENDPAKADARATRTGRRLMIWAGKAPPGLSATRVEDGFLRSRGLGAALVPPMSLVTDDLGIYYDPHKESGLERLIASRETLRPDQQNRAEALIARLIDLGLSKYNLGLPAAELPSGPRLLVPGQVEDDASIRLGAGEISTNLALLKAARAANPGATLLYKPHPDVEAGLRRGSVPQTDLDAIGCIVLRDVDPASLLQEVDELWTMTSLMGFEALLRGVRVTTTGAPFYAGWGLTRDRGAPPPRRRARPSLAGLVHAALIDYPRYVDPKTGLPCPVEVALDRLSSGDIPHPGRANRALSKLQGVFASYAGLWR
ncbi:capsular polysaccharide biosynthesis protein [Roseovarius aestuariivivens]|uniref:capsular polysaccharide biosynthesis protein n=1 Tax=Roseovarius aestuariivivens TaxID=1888910 RepID=UPI0010803B86|nr:capsular polysaccharide biosynthesis protein [Roseovarius aestuariivivens]